MVRRFSLRWSLFLVGCDAGLVVLALRLSEWVRASFSLGIEAPDETWSVPGALYVIGPAIWIGCFVLCDLYSPRRTFHLIGELTTMLGANVLALLLFAGTLYCTHRDYSRLQFVYFIIVVTALTLGHRVAVRGFFRLVGGRSYDSRRVVIVGTGRIARRVAEAIANYRWGGLYLAGYVSHPDEDLPGPADAPPLEAPLLGSIEDLSAVVKDHSIQEVVATLPWRAQGQLLYLVHTLNRLRVNVRVVPDYSDLAFLRTRVEDFGGMALIGLREPALSPPQRLIKRLFDLTFTLIVLVPALPLMALIALAIWLDDGSPLIYRQERVGEGKRSFTMYKFRTMYAGADQDSPERIAVGDKDGRLIYKHADDPRVTRVGRWLRRASLDELPQLFNVLRGQMSLVGPRPEMPWLVDKYQPWQHARFEVPQGITGWWQVTGRADMPMYLSTDKDLFYIRNYSLLLDIQILCRTVAAVISGRGAF